jgi:hypothetical protein
MKYIVHYIALQMQYIFCLPTSQLPHSPLYLTPASLEPTESTEKSDQGKVESWNEGMVERIIKGSFSHLPFFQYSIIPAFFPSVISVRFYSPLPFGEL